MMNASEPSTTKGEAYRRSSGYSPGATKPQICQRMTGVVRKMPQYRPTFIRTLISSMPDV